MSSPVTGIETEEATTECQRNDCEDARRRSHMNCSETSCENSAAVRLFIPGNQPRLVCPAHGRVIAQRDGVVAEVLDTDEVSWP